MVVSELIVLSINLSIIGVVIESIVEENPFDVGVGPKGELVVSLDESIISMSSTPRKLNPFLKKIFSAYLIQDLKPVSTPIN